jgi:hypothetical protein
LCWFGFGSIPRQKCVTTCSQGGSQFDFLSVKEADFLMYGNFVAANPRIWENAKACDGTPNNL